MSKKKSYKKGGKRKEIFSLIVGLLMGNYGEFVGRITEVSFAFLGEAKWETCIIELYNYRNRFRDTSGLRNLRYNEDVNWITSGFLQWLSFHYLFIYFFPIRFSIF